MKTNPAKPPRLIDPKSRRQMYVKDCQNPECAQKFVTHRNDQQYCDQRCRQRRKDNTEARRQRGRERHRRKYQADPETYLALRVPPEEKARIYGVPYEEIDRLQVYERDGWRCGICNRQVSKGRKYPDPLAATIDHIIPWARGGTHTYGNVQCAHLTCNLRKATRLPEEMRQSA